MLETFLSDVKEWAHKPYREEGTIFDWFLFVGLWICLSALWVTVIRRLAD